MSSTNTNSQRPPQGNQCYNIMYSMLVQHFCTYA